MESLTYNRARLLVLAVGSVAIAAITLSAFLRGADLVEVLATAMLIPILAGVAWRGTVGGVAIAVVVSVVYVVVRFSTLAGLELSEFVPSAVTRVVLYLLVGALGGAAERVLEQSLRKLELYDEIDDATGVGNARAALSLTDREQARAQRYGSMFSIAQLTIDHSAFEGVRHATALRTLRRYLQKVDGEVRTTDGVARITDATRDDIIVIMPETGPEGARIFADRLLASARAELGALGPAAGNGAIAVQALTFPGDDDEVAALRQRLERALAAEALAEADAG